MGRNAAQELRRIVSTIGGYLDRAEADPTLPLTYEGIQQRTGVSRGHLSRRSEPQILEVVARIAALKSQRMSGQSAVNTATSSAPSTAPAARSSANHAHLPDEALGVVIRRQLGEVARLQQMWLGRHGKGTASTDAALALYDADQLLMRLHATVERLRPAVAEWNQRRGVLLQTRTSAKTTEAEQAHLL